MVTIHLFVHELTLNKKYVSNDSFDTETAKYDNGKSLYYYETSETAETAKKAKQKLNKYYNEYFN